MTVARALTFGEALEFRPSGRNSKMVNRRVTIEHLNDRTTPTKTAAVEEESNDLRSVGGA